MAGTPAVNPAQPAEPVVETPPAVGSLAAEVLKLRQMGLMYLAAMLEASSPTESK